MLPLVLVSIVTSVDGSNSASIVYEKTWNFGDGIEWMAICAELDFNRCVVIVGQQYSWSRLNLSQGEVA